MAELGVRLAQPRLHRHLQTILVEAVVRGEYASGELLPREVDLVDRYGVSRGVVREAIRGLEEIGLIVVRHGHGAIVQDESQWDVLSADILPVLLTSPGSAAVLREVIEARQILEVEAAVLAAMRATPDHIARIQAAIAVMESLASAESEDRGGDTFLEADLTFHNTVIAATGNRALQRIVTPIHHALLEARRPLARPEYRVTRAVPEHAAVLTAIQAGDSEAARAAMQHVFGTITGYLTDYTNASDVSVADRGLR